ncbi:MAG: asparagine synthase (glutamine-hydrolyzing), partial [Lentisphaeria bacterium]|nr:asparagine synthase (glutamine-hydrolyzing) [Lentisphaeria bacterium]
MSGIAGYTEIAGRTADRLLLLRMAETMHRRGPDDSGIFQDRRVGLAHTRLAVVDLSDAGHQPFHSADGRFVLVYNGEIFNASELRQNELRDYPFVSYSDTEVLLAMLIRFGCTNDTLKKLNGFFAFALYDRQEETLFLARDRFGVKPLIYLYSKEYFAFASTLEALKELPFFDRKKLRDDALVDFLSFQYIPKEKTIYEDVYKLLPGHTLVWKAGKITLNRWYDPDYRQKMIGYEDACAELNRLVTGAVKRLLNADVPMGVFLSGGVDSAIVSNLAIRLSGQKLPLDSVGFQDIQYDETAFAKETAAFIRNQTGKKPDHRITTVESAYALDLLQKMLRQTGEPYADASLLPFSRLCAFAGESGLRVALTGDGADEFFYGYDRYRAMRLFRYAHFLPCDLIRKFLPKGGNERSSGGRADRFFRIARIADEKQRYLAIVTHEAQHYFADLFVNEIRSGGAGMPGIAPDPADSAARFDYFTYMPGDVLVKSDIGSMSAGLEIRSPFLDHEVADFAFSLPAEYKLQGRKRKRILADAFSGILPPGLAERPKRGFGVPVADWLRGGWYPEMRALLLNLPGEIFRRDT